MPPPPPKPPDLGTILKKPELEMIAKQYNPITMGQLLRVGLIARHKPIEPYLDGIGATLYPEFDPSGKSTPLPSANRERCLVALLASRSRSLELAIHLYLALVNGVAAAELAHILVATGVYTGVDTIGHAFAVTQTTLETLQKLAKAGKVDPATVLGALAKAFPG